MFNLYVVLDFGKGEKRIFVGISSLPLSDDEVIQKAIIVGILDIKVLKYVKRAYIEKC